jgi:hypothetical protein
MGSGVSPMSKGCVIMLSLIIAYLNRGVRALTSVTGIEAALLLGRDGMGTV